MSRRSNRRTRESKFVALSEPLESRRLLAASLVYNGTQTLTPGATINVSSDSANAQSEMSLVVNPTNPLNLVGFSHRLSTPITLDVYSSSNGGLTWSTNQINNADDGFGVGGNRFDPAIGFDAGGVCYIVYGHREAGTPNRTRLIGARSTDGGVNFGNFRTIDIQNDRGTSPGLDKWYIHSGLDPASGNQAMYVAWVHFALEGAMNNINDDRILLSGTRDGGNTWTAPLLLNDPSAVGAETGPTYACPVVGRNGELAVSWHDMGDDTVMLDRDLDGLWAGPFTFGADITVRTGVTVQRDLMIPPAQPERGVNAAPMLEVWRNTNWLLMPVVEQFGAGNDLDIWVGISTSFGESWSFQRVEGAVSTDFNPWLQVDQRTGVFHVLYQSTDGDPSGNDDVRPKIASSFNAGQTWQRGFLSTQTSNEAGGYAGDYLEYLGLAARDGTVHGLWPSRYGGGGQDLDAFTANAAYVSTIGDNRLVIGETGGPDDNYLVRLAPNNSAFLEVFLDGVREFTGLRQSINHIIFNPGGGTNSFNIQTIPGLSSLTINGTNNAETINIDFLGASMPALTMVLADGDDTVTLGQDVTSFLTINSPVNVFGNNGSDTLNMGNGNGDAVNASVTFDGGGGGWIDTIAYNDGGQTDTVEYDISPTTVTRHSFVPPKTLTYSNLDFLDIFAGSGGDQFTVRNNVGTIARCFGNSGNDNFIFGDGMLTPGGGHVFNAGAGSDLITFDDRNQPAGRFWDIFTDRVIYGGAFNFLTVGFERVSILAGNGGDTFTIGNSTFTQTFTFDLGGGNDVLNLNSPRANNMTVRGGAGFDSFQLDDTFFTSNSLGGEIRPNEIVRQFSAGDFRINYDDFEFAFYKLAQAQNVVSVFGVSSDITSEFQIIGNTSDEVVEVFPRDAANNLTINGKLIIQGGGGSTNVVQVADAANSPGINYTLSNDFGGGLAVVRGVGSGFVGVLSDMGRLDVIGGGGNDSFAVNEYRSGTAVALYGGGGNDTCTIGNGNMQANLTNAAAFTFDGQSGSDRFTVANGLTTSGWSYGINTGFLASSITGVYSWTSTLLNLESQYVFAGSGGDSFAVVAAATGLYTECNGAGGYDVMSMGFAFVNIHLDGIRGPVVFNANADGGRAILDDTTDATGDIAHLTAATLGAFVGDTMFGPGGSFTFSGLSNFGTTEGLTIWHGTGADTLYAQPLAGTRVVIDGRDPTAVPGDQLNLALAGVQNANVTHGSSGSVTSSNRQTLNWTSMEQATQPIDAIAPTVVAADINLNGIPGPADGGNRRQSLDVRFSENVIGLLNPSWLQLTNLTTNQTVPTANIAVEYAAATNTAHFTFPGYPDGVLPDGDYSGKVLAGLPDFFGNGLPADAPFNFFFLQGDANHDRRVNLADFNILASNFGTTGTATFSQADFNYDGNVNLADFNILAARFGTVLGPNGQLNRSDAEGIPDAPRSWADDDDDRGASQVPV